VTRTSKLTALALGLSLMAPIAAPMAAHASGYERLDEATRARITETLTEQGYEVRKIERDDGMYEVYALKDGERYELYLDQAMTIVKSERDD